MHHGNPDRSRRLARALAYVQSAGPVGCTTAELQSWTLSMAPATDISELRQSGYQIDCKAEGMNNGRRVYRYTYQGRIFDAKETP